MPCVPYRDVLRCPASDAQAETLTRLYVFVAGLVMQQHQRGAVLKGVEADLVTRLAALQVHIYIWLLFRIWGRQGVNQRRGGGPNRQAGGTAGAHLFCLL
jgi:hypothetical protein